MNNELSTTIQKLVVKGKGILAADESNPTIEKRFKNIQIESSEENRRAYRELLFTTPQLSDYISGIILYEETLNQKTENGTPFPELLTKNGIVPGIKVDKGTIPLSSSPEEKITQGLDSLADRLNQYKKMGARFAKWRAVLNISDKFPSDYAIHANAEALARYASICQTQGIVPIVEPELLMDGNHSLQRCLTATEKTLHHLFHTLYLNGVKFEYMILKPNMVIPGVDHRPQSSVTDVAEATVAVLKRTVPAAVPSINFLSGGQSDELATAHLNAINKLGPLPWYVSFSYGRALQAPALKQWQGNNKNIENAQLALFKRAKLNGVATKGGYTEGMES